MDMAPSPITPKTSFPGVAFQPSIFSLLCALMVSRRRDMFRISCAMVTPMATPTA